MVECQHKRKVQTRNHVEVPALPVTAWIDVGDDRDLACLRGTENRYLGMVDDRGERQSISVRSLESLRPG